MPELSRRTPTEKAVHLWCLPQDAQAREVVAAQGQSSLSRRDRQKLAAITNDGRARSFLLGRALLRAALAHRLGCAPQDLVFDEKENGKLFLIGPQVTGLDFSLSHAGSEPLVAVAEVDGLGIDLETYDRGPQVLKIAGRLFAPEERCLLEGAGDEAASRALYHWTLKEAVTKALGETIWQAVGQVAFRVEGGDIAWHSQQPRGEPDDWTLLSGRFRQNHCFAVAIWHPSAPCLEWRLRTHLAGDGSLESRPYEILATTSGRKLKID